MDKLAESGTDELMFMEGEAITVLMQLGQSALRHVPIGIVAGHLSQAHTLLVLRADNDRYLGSCEGVVGIFQ